MDIRESREAGFLVVEPVGRLDTKTSRELENKLVELLDRGERRFVVDMAQVEYVGSSGLRVLLMAAKKLQGTNGHLVLCGIGQPTQEVLEVAGLNAIFTTALSRREAVLGLPGGSRSPALRALAQKFLGSPIPGDGAPQRITSAIRQVAARAAGVLLAQPPGSSGRSGGSPG